MATIKEVSEKVGLSIYTIRYYTDKGLVPDLKRDANGNRVFDDEAVNWLKAIKFFRSCGLSLKETQHYFKLCLQPQNTFQERYQIVKDLKEKAERDLAAITERNQILQQRLDHLAAIKAGKAPDNSNPLDWDPDKFC